MMNCPYCAEDVDEGASRCPHCEEQIASASPQSTTLSTEDVQQRAEAINALLAAGDTSRSLLELAELKSAIEASANAAEHTHHLASVKQALEHMKGRSVRPPSPGRRLKVVFALAIIVVGLAFSYQSGSLPAVNRLQTEVSAELGKDPRNSGIVVKVNRSLTDTLTLDLSFQENKAALDVIRVLFQTADALKNEAFSKVILASHGTDKFYLEGPFFQELGREYSSGQNTVYMSRTLPEHVRRLDGSAAFGTWTGGLIGVTGKQLEDLNDFCRTWCL